MTSVSLSDNLEHMGGNIDFRTTTIFRPSLPTLQPELCDIVHTIFHDLQLKKNINLLKKIAFIRNRETCNFWDDTNFQS